MPETTVQNVYYVSVIASNRYVEDITSTPVTKETKKLYYTGRSTYNKDEFGIVLRRSRSCYGYATSEEGAKSLLEKCRAAVLERLEEESALIDDLITSLKAHAEPAKGWIVDCVGRGYLYDEVADGSISCFNNSDYATVFDSEKAAEKFADRAKEIYAYMDSELRVIEKP